MIECLHCGAQWPEDGFLDDNGYPAREELIDVAKDLDLSPQLAVGVALVADEKVDKIQGDDFDTLTYCSECWLELIKDGAQPDYLSAWEEWV